LGHHWVTCISLCRWSLVSTIDEEAPVSKAADEAVEQHERNRVSMGQHMGIERLREIMHHAFPAGTLPGETAPVTFTHRELEIFRHINWQTDEMEMRLVTALMETHPRVD
jgi:hypothetical protein